MKTEIKNYLIWIVIVLLVANLTAFVTVYVKLASNREIVKTSNRGERNRFPRTKGTDIIKELQFNGDQLDEFSKIRKGHHQKVAGIQGELHFLRKEIAEALSEEAVDSSKIDSLANQFGILQAGLKREVFRHFADLKDICNDGQKKILMQKINEVVDQNMPGPGNRMRKQHSKLNSVNKNYTK